jgi:hypothetical protein
MVDVAIRVAEQFARHIADADYNAAHSLLTKAAQQKYSPDSFKQSFQEMTAYEPGPIHRVEVDLEFALEDWPARMAGDIASVYVGLFGEEYVEAVTLVVSREDGDIRVRDVEWGRP